MTRNKKIMIGALVLLIGFIGFRIVQNVSSGQERAKKATQGRQEAVQVINGSTPASA